MQFSRLRIVFFALAAGLAACQGPRPVREDFLDPNFYEVTVDRSAYGRVIFLSGDSILRGYALKKFPDMYTPEQIKTERRWEQRSPAAMINARSSRDEGHPFAVFVGPSGLPDEVKTDLLEHIDGRLVREGDMIVFEDAGKHDGSPSRYAEHVRTIRTTLCGSKATLLFLNTYDHITPGTYDPAEEEFYRWSVPFDGQTMNEALAKAVEAPLPGCGKSQLGDVHAALSRIQQEGISPVHGDGIHPNVIGQAAIAEIILAASNNAQ